MSWHVDVAPLSKVANHEKNHAEGVHPQGRPRHHRRCAPLPAPLIAGEAYPPYGRNGLPDYVVLPQATIRRKLPAWAG
jgi:hypothetical protein